MPRIIYLIQGVNGEKRGIDFSRRIKIPPIFSSNYLDIDK